jgi:RND family efflux transporter MFP subunit
MNTEHRDETEKGGPRAEDRRRKVVFALLPPVVLLLAVGGAVWLIKTSPKPRQGPPREQVALVKTVALQRARRRIVLRTTGTVVPARRVTLRSRVSGEIVEVSPEFVPGARFVQGEVILRIDPEDYRLAVESRKADVARAEFEYKLELGQQDIAKREWSLVEDKADATGLDEELTLRKPHLRKATAALEGAQAALGKAELDLKRTGITAPFNLLVLDRQVNLGAQVSPQTALAEIVGTDEYWVEVTIPADRLPWVRLPGAEGEPGSPARVRTPAGLEVQAEWPGRVIQRRANLERAGRLAQLIVSVQNPLNGARGGSAVALLLGMYVRVEIEGPEMEAVFSVPRMNLQHGDSVWLMNADDRLEIRKVEIAWRDREQVLVRRGLADGERLVVSDIPAPVPGMLLKEQGKTEAESYGKVTKDAEG